MITKFDKVLRDNKYVSLTGIEMFRPTGLQVPYIEYVKVLELWHRELIDVEERLLAPLSKWVASMLGDPSKLKHLTSIDKFDLIDEVALVTAMRGTVAEKDRGTSTSYGQLIQRNSDWNIVTATVNEMYKEYLASTPANIHKTITGISENINLLLTRINENPSTYTVSGSVVNTLAKVLHRIGREVELYGVHGYNLKVMVNNLDQNHTRLNEILK